ncbi:hypothetical protein CYMTET_49096 [Cymbomonas tetramitiformis]|uniref:PH domain-containing protein n=1 Tax=Cymbomonas tetramitiformis TaxID=36881 RepID=A0AAE0BQW5_9CHLO|nr:hypothetical protein CYMTET_49096 [Cymbomonas tetramitiformis]
MDSLKNRAQLRGSQCVATQNNEKIICEGVLEKNQNTVLFGKSSWQKRKFTMYPAELVWSCSREEDVGTVNDGDWIQKGSASLADFMWSKDDQPGGKTLHFEAFQLNKNRRRQFILRAETNEICQEWRDSFNKVQGELKAKMGGLLTKKNVNG